MTEQTLIDKLAEDIVNMIHKDAQTKDVSTRVANSVYKMNLIISVKAKLEAVFRERDEAYKKGLKTLYVDYDFMIPVTKTEKFMRGGSDYVDISKYLRELIDKAIALVRERKL